uniref:Secreted protein n=1 Tax=Eutreptiella gymnastica TaxID=73025 RepID=A0A7S1I3Z7_9EUGL
MPLPFCKRLRRFSLLLAQVAIRWSLRLSDLLGETRGGQRAGGTRTVLQGPEHAQSALSCIWVGCGCSPPGPAPLSSVSTACLKGVVLCANAHHKVGAGGSGPHRRGYCTTASATDTPPPVFGVYRNPRGIPSWGALRGTKGTAQWMQAQRALLGA